jgi:predicted RND superfamily exporter protein
MIINKSIVVGVLGGIILLIITISSAGRRNTTTLKYSNNGAEDYVIVDNDEYKAYVPANYQLNDVPIINIVIKTDSELKQENYIKAVRDLEKKVDKSKYILHYPDEGDYSDLPTWLNDGEQNETD